MAICVGDHFLQAEQFSLTTSSPVELRGTGSNGCCFNCVADPPVMFSFSYIPFRREYGRLRVQNCIAPLERLSRLDDSGFYDLNSGPPYLGVYRRSSENDTKSTAGQTMLPTGSKIPICLPKGVSKGSIFEHLGCPK